jgi:hypothetical protein
MADQKPIPTPVAPEPLTFPQAMLDKWFAHSGNEYLDVAFTRNDWDILFSTLNNSISAQNALDQALVEWSNGNTEAANSALNESRRLRGESSNALKRFFFAIMASAVQRNPSNV